MKKKFCGICLLMTLVGTLSAVAETIEVGTMSEFRTAVEMAIANGTAPDIVLTDNIDMTGWTTPSGVFRGTIGGACTEKNEYDVEVPSLHGFYGASEPLLESVEESEIHDLFISSFSMQTISLFDGYGALATEARDMKFYNIVLSQITMDTGDDYAGALLARAYNCAFESVLVENSKLTADGTYAGGIVGLAEGCTFEDCSTNVGTMVYAEGDGTSAYAGGLVGRTVGGSFTGCTNMASVGGDDDCIGGLVGHSEGTSFFSCANIGLVTMTDEDRFAAAAESVAAAAVLAGGLYAAGAAIAASDAVMYALGTKILISEMAKYGVFRFSLAQGGYTYMMTANMSTLLAAGYIVLPILIAAGVGLAIYLSQEPDEMGGICGSAVGGTFSCCINGGSLTNLDAYCGGIVGYAENGNTALRIVNCMNEGYVTGDEQTGGIVGKLASGTVESCLNVGQVNTDSEETWGRIYGQLGSSAASRDNYLLSTPDDPGASDRITVTQQQLASGAVALALNGTAANSAATSPVWHQNVRTGDSKDNNALYPRPSGEYGVVTDATIAAFNGDINHYVATGNDLYRAVANPYAHIKLSADVELGSRFNLMSQRWPFQGVLDGNGYTITGFNYNDDIDEAASSMDAMGLFLYAEGAAFKNLTINGADIYADNNAAALVAFSKGCRYENITFTGLGKVHVDDAVVGALIGASQNDTLQLVTVGGGWHITADGTGVNAYAGGIVGQATGSTFTSCSCAATVVGNDNHVGGIAALATRCTFTDCSNEGIVQHEVTTGITAIDDYVGGIAAYAKGCTFDRCVNSASILCGDESAGGICGYAAADGNRKSLFTNCLNTGAVTTDDDFAGGIVGSIYGSSIANCLNMGTVKGDYSGGIFGHYGEGASWTNNYYLNDSYRVDDSGRCGVNTSLLATGQVAWWLNGSTSADTSAWHQNLSGSNKDGYPVLDATHAAVIPQNFTNAYHISTASELLSFAQYVNENDITPMKPIAYLDADIDLTNCEWTPIGTEGNPFKGYFNGQGHTIDHLVYTGTTGRIGLFGTVGAGAEIRNVILGPNSSIATTCTLRDHGGVAGIVGCASGNDNGTVTIIGCGNEATVSGPNVINVAGILGAVYLNDGVHVHIAGCYNSGTITGVAESAAICGYARFGAVITSCFDEGTVYGNDNNTSFARMESDGTLTNCFHTNGYQSGVTTFDGSLDNTGAVCYMLNDQKNEGSTVYWQLDLGQQNPRIVPGDKGIYYTRSLTNRYGTVTLPFSTVSDDHVQLYILSDESNGDELVFTAVDDLSAGTPALFCVEEGATSVTLLSTDESEFDWDKGMTPVVAGDWTMRGSLSNYSTYPSFTDEGIYYIAQNRFWYAEKPATVGTYRAWLRNTADYTGSITLRTDGTATAIRPAELSEDETPAFPLLPSDSYYDLQGRRVESPTNGIYICGGKKVMVK